MVLPGKEAQRAESVTLLDAAFDDGIHGAFAVVSVVGLGRVGKVRKVVGTGLALDLDLVSLHAVAATELDGLLVLCVPAELVAHFVDLVFVPVQGLLLVAAADGLGTVVLHHVRLPAVDLARLKGLGGILVGLDLT